MASLRTRVLAELAGRPQAQMDCDLALREVEAALARLGRHGFHFHLEPGPPGPDPEFPKMMFHLTAAPLGRWVNSKWDLEELGPDWWPTLEAAQHADGVATQFAGRGGVARRGGLRPSGPPRDFAAEKIAANAELERRIAAWKKEHAK